MRTCTCCPFHSVRPSHCPCRRNEQREASRRYVYTMPYITLIITTNITKKYHKHTHETFTVALFLTTFKKLRSSTLSKPKRQVNAFSIMSSPTHEPCRRERCDKGTTSRAENKIIQLFFIPRRSASSYCVVLKVVIIYDNSL